jgi:hypothetical protein
MTDRWAKHAEDCKAVEAGIISDFDAQSAVERELVQRLPSGSNRPKYQRSHPTGFLCTFRMD